ncbi:MAG: SLC13 family permease [Gammaproteobacteria bacterium]|nr:SLC13 family permease [Gammaproteobacteria bacterium]
MPLPDPHIVAVWLLVLLALWLFAQDRVAHESAALGFLVVVLLVVHFFPLPAEVAALSPGEVVARLGHPALVTIIALVILARGLESTGAFARLFEALGRLWQHHPGAGLPAMLLVAGVLSAVLSNAAVVVMIMPALIGIALQQQLRPSRLLMPIGFAVLIGGMASAIGASTNLVALALAADLGAPPIGIAELAWPVSIVGLLALLYLWLLAPRLLPERNAPLGDTAPRVFAAVLRIDEDSAAAGLTLPAVRALTDNQLRVDRVQRGENLFVAKLPSLVIQPGDRLHVRDLPERLKRFERALGATLATELPGDVVAGTQQDAIQGQQLAEVVVTRGALLHQSTLGETRFASRFGLLPLALHRARAEAPGEPVADIANTVLRAGDVILVQGSRQALEHVRRSGDALVLDGTMDLPRSHRAPRALAVFALVVLLAASGWLPLAACALGGVALMLATRCLAWRDLPQVLSARLILTVAAGLTLALLLERSGAAAALATGLVPTLSAWPPALVLATFMGVLLLVTTVTANVIVAAVGVSVAVPLALVLGAPVQAYVLAALFGASLSFMRPGGYQSNLLLLSTGGYRRGDFARVGTPLALLLWLAFSGLLALRYGLLEGLV